MGQYFKAFNLDKKEVVNAWDLGGVAKFWEWCLNKWSGIFPYLLRKSDEGGGGDIDMDKKGIKYAGRWAGDRIALVGDYDSSNLWDKKEYKDISKKVKEEFNREAGLSSKFLCSYEEELEEEKNKRHHKPDLVLRAKPKKK